MIRQHPISTLFPYTTLFRSQLVRLTGVRLAEARQRPVQPADLIVARAAAEQPPVQVGRHRQHAAADRHARLVLRSEEHTSELQSHVNLVCRLLLEKKKRV